jgi:hypothetical protein
MEVAVAAMEEEEANDGDGGSDHRGPCLVGEGGSEVAERGDKQG